MYAIATGITKKIEYNKYIDISVLFPIDPKCSLTNCNISKKNIPTISGAIVPEGYAKYVSFNINIIISNTNTNTV